MADATGGKGVTTTSISALGTMFESKTKNVTTGEETPKEKVVVGKDPVEEAEYKKDPTKEKPVSGISVQEVSDETKTVRRRLDSERAPPKRTVRISYDKLKFDAKEQDADVGGKKDTSVNTITADGQVVEVESEDVSTGVKSKREQAGVRMIFLPDRTGSH